MNGMQPWLPLTRRAHLLQHDVLRRQSSKVELRRVCSGDLPLTSVADAVEAGDVLLVPPRALHRRVKNPAATTMYVGMVTSTIADCMDALQLFQFPLLFRLGDQNVRSFTLDYRRCSERPTTFAEQLDEDASAELAC